MNKEYVIDKDKVFVSKGNGEIKELPNYDVTKDILETENIIEELERLIKFSEYMKGTYAPIENAGIKDAVISATLVFSPMVCGALLEYLYNINTGIINISESITLSTPVFISTIMAGLVMVGNIVKGIKDRNYRKQCENIQRGYDISNEYLRNKKKEAEDRLLMLNQIKELNTNNDVKITKFTIHNEELLKDIMKENEFRYHAGCNLDKYYKHYLDGTLQFVLEKRNEVNELDNYIDFIEEEGPKLIKNFRHSDMY